MEWKDFMEIEGSSLNHIDANKEPLFLKSV